MGDCVDLARLQRVGPLDGYWVLVVRVLFAAPLIASYLAGFLAAFPLGRLLGSTGVVAGRGRRGLGPVA